MRIKTFTMALAAILSAFAGWAADLTPKAVLENGGATLRLVYDSRDYGTEDEDWFPVRDGTLNLGDGSADAVLYGHMRELDAYIYVYSITNIVVDSSFASYRPTRAFGWFAGFPALVSIDGLKNFNTSAITDFSRMFYNCAKLERLDLSSFDTLSATRMNYMFRDCSSLKTLDLTSFHTPCVTSFSYMFEGCGSLTTIYASPWFTTGSLSETSSTYVFDNCRSLVGGAGTAYSYRRYDLKYARLDRPGAPGYFSQKPGTLHYFLFVDATMGSDANEGHRSDCAKKTIQAAVDAVAEAGDVYVAAGTYAPFSVSEKDPVCVQGTGGVNATIIDGGDSTPCAVLGNATLTGFTLQRGRATSSSQGAAACYGTVRNCVIRNCTGSGAGGASGCLGSVVENTLCYSNTCSSTASGVLVNSTVRNCTVVDNIGYGLMEGTSVNTISWNNRNRVGGWTTDASSSATNATDRTYCFFTESAGLGTGNKCGDPKFVDAANGDYRLAAGSPCLDAGTNAEIPGASDMDGHERVINGTIDIGCYERADYLRALDVDFDAVFNGGAETDWLIVTNESSYGGTSVRSAPIGNSEQTSVSLTVTGSGVLSFAWKVDCKGRYDYLFCRVDGVDRKITSGSVDWTTVRLYLDGTGDHTIAWRYSKGYSGSSGEDCGWIDHVTWEPGAANPTPGIYTEVASENEWNYRIVDGVASLGGDSMDFPALNTPYSGTVNLSLPYSLGGYRIGRIGDYAFYNCTWLSGFSSWTCSYLDNVTEIGAHAFEGCTSLGWFNIPDGVATIGESAFKDCSSLKSLALSSAVARCGKDVVSNCTSLRDLLVQSSLENVLSFSGCSSLQTIRYTDDKSLPTGSYGGVSSAATLYVKSSSEGWGCTIPGTWCGVAIDTFENQTARQLEALDFTGDGDFEKLDNHLWEVAENTSAEGGTALRISDVYAYDSSSISLTVEGRGTLTFRWKTSSSSGDSGLRCIIDGTEYDRISGYSDWTEVIAEIKDEGTHEICWKYEQSHYSSGYSHEGWLDCVTWTPGERELKPGTDVLLWAPSVSSDTEVSGAVTKILNVLKEAYGTRIPAMSEYAESYPDGIKVKTLTGKSYSVANLTGNLDGYGLVFVLFPKSGIPAAQVERLKTVVARGARVVLQGEHASWSPDENDVLTQLAKDMGADFAILDGAKAGTDVYNASSDLLKESLSTYPDSKSVAPISYSGVAQDVAHLAEDKSYVWAVDEASGNGRVTAISDISWYCDTGSSSGTLYEEAIPFLERLLSNAIANEKKVIDGEDPNADVEEKVPEWANAAVRDNNGLLTYYTNVVNACSAASDGFAVTNRLVVALKRDIDEPFLLPEGVTFETIGITTNYEGEISVPTGCELVVNDAGDVFKSVGVRPPETPVVTATDGTYSNRVEISWSVPESVKPILAYEVKRTKVGSTLETTLASSTTNTTFTDTSARVGVHYTYSVRAQSAAGWGFAGSDEGWSNATGLVPDPVLEVTATDGTSSNAVVVAWTPDTNSAITVTHYEVRRAPKGTDSWTTIATDVDPAVTSYTDSTASAGVDYDYQVRVGNSDGWSAATSDAGWRAIELSLGETSWSPDAGATNKAVTVTSNADWAISDSSGEASVTTTEDGLDVSLAENESTDGRSGSVTVTAGGATDHPVSGTFSYAQAGRPIPLPVAVDMEDWEFETGTSVADGAVWYGQPKVSHDGVDAARSGALSGAGSTWFETTVTNAGDLAFFWKTSCEPTYDGLSFSVDGTTRARLSGVADEWKELRFEIPSGTHVLRWTYSKDEKNDAGEDCGWVDQITWTPLAAPAWNELGVAAVSASDGTSSDCVSITWSPFASGRPVAEYELSRAVKGSATWEVLMTTNALGFVDSTATPGVDYTYRVRARNAAGWGAPEEDDGWRAYSLAVGAEALSFASEATSGTLAVTANADWTITSSDDWISASADAASGDSGVATSATVSVDANESLEAREGAVTVTIGTGDHAVSVDVKVVQSARPPKIDVGFVKPFEDWRTRLQVVTNTTVADVYEPVSVLLAGDPMSLSFGWTNRSEVAVAVPDVLFKVFAADGTCVSEWTAEGRSDETLAVGAGTYSGGWAFGVLRVLQPGDYMIKAEIAPKPKYTDVNPDDNVAVFRFAVRDPSVTLEGDVFADPQWRTPEAKAGNDFAQPPHAAATNVVQFGPYVPMNGLVGRSSNGKQPLDLIFLVDVTGSMWGCIDALKENIRQFFDALVTGEDRVTDWRAKVVAYRDITCDSPWYQDWGFTTDPDAMRDEIARCYASGGGDYEESLLDAVYRISTETEFREGAARAILAFTDAEYKTPMSYGAGKGLGWQKAAQATKDSEVVLKLIACPWYGGADLKTFAEGCYSTNSEYIAVNSLSSTSLSEDMLRQLAKSVSKSVKTTVVEPSLSVSTRGKGTLSFEWKNDSTAGTNNVFRFSCDDGEGNTNFVNEAGSGWQNVSLDLEAGWHLFKWSYGKTDYDGAIVDCGKIRNLVWEPYATELTLDPIFNEVDHEGARDAETLSDGKAGQKIGGGNQKVKVTCNSTWKVVDETVPDWIKIVAGAGDGNGEIWYQVETNALHVSRSATITVRAGEYGLASDLILEKTFKVSQKASPYVENGAIQILTVDVKPRWPWNDVIDIDFRVLTPATSGTPVKVSVVGVNEEGGEMLQYYPALKAASEVKPTTGRLTSPQGFEVGADYIVCPTSGLYRVTWTDMAKNWYSKYSSIGSYAGWKENGFHTPAFSVRLTGTCDGVAEVKLPSDPVRVDMRQNAVSKTSTHSTTEHSGGAILTGTERIGHPTGAVDPIEVDTTDATLFPSNGWNKLDAIVKDLGATELYSNRFDRACVINDADIEGGLIMTDTVWRADRVHVVRDNVFVHKDATLTIEDGAVVKFCYNTYLFIYKDPDKTGVEEFNIRMKGCYLTCGYDASYGGNTLYYNVKGATSDTNEKWNGLSAIPILSNASSGENFLPQVSSSDARAATRVSLQCKVNEKWTSWKDRFYSRGQHWGVLPRPSEEGMEFYGWYCGDPSTWLGTSLDASKYSVSKAFMISADGTPFDTETYGTGTTMTKVSKHFRDGQIFALMCSSGWAESVWDLVDASDAQIVLENESVYYDGTAHKPSVASVSVNDARVDPGNYTVTYPEGDCVNVGSYDVSVSFLADYTGTPSTTFRILPRPTDGGAVVLEPTSRKYLPASLGGSAKPSVSVSIPGMASVPSGDYEVTWPDAEGRWPRIGVYTVVATFNDNYTGPSLTNTFEITMNPDYVYTEYGTKEEAVKAAEEAGGKRILYIGGREGDAMTQYVKNLIKNDTDLNDWVIANFSCWADSVASVSDLKFADGLATVETPLLAVLGERDDESFVARHAGYFADAAELKAFLQAALDAKEIVDASGAVITLSRTSATYDGTVQKPTVTSATLRGETLASGTDYKVEYGEGDWTSVGSYAFKIVFCGSYTNETDVQTFEIVPAALAADQVALDPASATYDGTVQKPSVTPVDGIDFAVDYGTGGYVEVDDYAIRVTATGCATGVVEKTFSIAAQPVTGGDGDGGDGEAVEIVLDVDGAEIRRGKDLTESAKPNVLAVRKGEKTFVAGVDYDVDYGDGDYLSAGTNTITVTFKGHYSGSASVTFEIVETVDAVVSVEGDEGAEVGTDPSDPDRTLVRPSDGVKSVVLVIPEGVDASKVTVVLSRTVERVTPRGASVRILGGDGTTDITSFLVLPAADAGGLIDLTAARVVDAVVREVLDPSASADNVVRWEDGGFFLQTVTRRGLRYVLYEGEKLDAMHEGASTTGDGKPWIPSLTVRGGTSGFYSIHVTK